MRHLLHLGILGLAGVALTAGQLTVPASAVEPDPSGLTVHEQHLMAEDTSLHASDEGRLYAVDQWHPPSATAAASTAETEAAGVEKALASASTTDALALHSRPGAARSIYLDFDGGSLLGINLWVLNGLSLTGLLFNGWSVEGTALTFSDGERAVIREVWARVAEDFAAWDVDVTTQEPPAGGLWRASGNDPTYGMRVAFSNDSSVQTNLCGGGCGGVAWIGTFGEVTTAETGGPAWVFPGSLGQRAKYMAEAAAHEVGHTLGLNHDGTTSVSYYSGTPLWGPIMGSPYSAAITQWSKGGYTGADNTEDDLAVIGAHGLSLRVDEAGGTPATAAALSTLPGGDGVISSPADSDWYALTDCTGTLTAAASPAPTGPGLDIALELRNAAGALIASNAPATTRSTTTGPVTGLGASLSVPLTGGPYYLAVSGAGSGAGGASGWSSGGYDRYGSIGSYRLLMAGCGGASGVPVPPPADVPFDPSGTPDPVADLPTIAPPARPTSPSVAKGARGGRTSIGVSWAAPASGTAITGYLLTAYRLDAKGRVVAKKRTGVLSGTLSGVDLGVPTKGRWAVRIKARNALGWGPLSPRSAAAKAR